MTTHLEQELEEVKLNIFKMADLSIEAISDSVDSLINSDTEKANRIISNDSLIDILEMETDEECIRILVTRQPAATCLRLVLTMLKINTDIERIGDLCTNIARETIRLNGTPPLKPLIDIPRMAFTGIDMIKKSMQAISVKDADLARHVIEMDKIIDELDMQIYRELFTFMAENTNRISHGLGLIMVAKALERIGDHATNIAERAIYYIEGVDIRHGTALC